MLVSLGLSVERVANLGVGGGGRLGCPSSLSRPLPFTGTALVSISSDGGPCTGQEKGPLGFHIQFQEVGAQSLVRGVLKGGKGGGAKVRHSTVRTGTGISRGRVREGGKDPPFGT